MFLEMLAIGLLLAVASMAVSELLRPKPKFENARPAGLGDFNFPTAVEGRVIPLVWGTVRLSGPNVVWYGDLSQIPIQEKVPTGLWSSSRITTGYKYRVGIQFALCLGEVESFPRVWIGDKPLSIVGTRQYFNELTLFGTNGGLEGWLQLYTGSDTQSVDPYLSSFQSPQPAYRGTAYAVWERGYVGDSPQIQAWKFEVSRFPTIPGLPDGQRRINSSKDANPAAVLYEILTDVRWGFAFPSTDIDTASFLDAAETLSDEGNGFSMILDNPLEASGILDEVQRQIDGVVYLDQQTGKFTLKLARADYDIDTVPVVDSTNQVEVKEYTRGAWDETANQVRVKFADRGRDYFETYAIAGDLANQEIQNGTLVAVQQNYPGVKDRDLAASIAAREIRALGVPIAKATIVTDRSTWQLVPGDVVAWTDANLGVSKMAMRVNHVDFGELTDGRITLSLTQDLFAYSAAFDGAPPDTGWEPPAEDVDAIPAGEGVAFEAPLALVVRDPVYPNVLDRIWAGGRHQDTGEYAIKIYQRNNYGGAPSGSYVESGEVYGFLKIGELHDALGLPAETATIADAIKTATIRVDPDPDAVADLLAAFASGVTTANIGQHLVHLLMIGDEFMCATSAADGGTYINLVDVYRGMLDTVPQEHAATTPVYLLFVGGGLSDDAIPPENQVDVQLRSVNRTDEVTQGEATTIQFTMANRVRLPQPVTTLGGYRVSGFRYWPTAINPEDANAPGSGLDGRGVTVGFVMRYFKEFDEYVKLAESANERIPDSEFLTGTAYEQRFRVIDDPLGSPSTIFESAYSDDYAGVAMRQELLRETGGVLSTTWRLEVDTRHTYEGETREATQSPGVNVSVEWPILTGATNLGVKGYDTVTNAWTADENETIGVWLGTALAGDVEYRINSGSWVQAIAAGNTSGTVTVSIGDSVEFRHLDNTGDNSAETMFEVADSADTGVKAYGVFTY